MRVFWYILKKTGILCILDLMKTIHFKKFPIGISTLEEIIFQEYYYIDKTSFVAKLAGELYSSPFSNLIPR